MTATEVWTPEPGDQVAIIVNQRLNDARNDTWVALESVITAIRGNDSDLIEQIGEALTALEALRVLVASKEDQ